MDDVNPFYDEDNLFDYSDVALAFGDETTAALAATTAEQGVSTPTRQSMAERKLWFESPPPPPKEEEEEEGFEFHQAVAQLQEHLNTMVATNAAAYSLSRFVPQTLRGLLTKVFSPSKQDKDEEDIKTIKLAWNTLILQVRTANTRVEIKRCVPALHAFAALCLHDSELVQKLDTTDEEVAEFIVTTWERWFGVEEEEGELCSGLLDVVRGLHLKEFIAKGSKLVVPPTMLRELYSKRWHDTPTPSSAARKVKRQRSTV